MTPDWLQEGEGSVILNLLIQPRASHNRIVGSQGQELKVRLTSPPVEGAANKLCCEFFGKLLGVAKGRVELVAGDRSRHKRIRIEGVSAAAVLAVIADDGKGN